ncbi:endonuclease III domain-containing protein [Myxococcota bacterium]
MSVRRVSAVLTRISGALGRAPEDLALTRVSRSRDPFRVLVACIISLRTKDEVTDEVAPRLLATASTPKALAALSESKIAALIYPAGFYRNKARTLRQLARTLLQEHAGVVPDRLDGLLALKGVGRKTANLVLTLGFGEPGICVDTHVHRISNRLGFAKTGAPDDTELVLRARLPSRWWIPINDLLVAFGRTVCTPLSPHCSICPVSDLCGRVGVERSR